MAITGLDRRGDILVYHIRLSASESFPADVRRAGGPICAAPTHVTQISTPQIYACVG